MSEGILNWFKSDSGKFNILNYTSEIKLYPETEDLKYGTGHLHNYADILAILLLERKIVINNHWWKKTWAEEHKQLFSIGVNCNDIFAWACADVEEVVFNELLDLWEFYKKDPNWGCDVWCMKKRNELPQKPVYDAIIANGIWDLDSMGLEPNLYDNHIQ
jgi:hypothetical protein